MKATRPKAIVTRSLNSDGSMVDRRWDNTGQTDFRGMPVAAGYEKAKQGYQDILAIEAGKKKPVPEQKVRKLGEHYAPDARHTLKGYESPVASRYYADRGLDIIEFTLPGIRNVSGRFEQDGTAYIIQEVTARSSGKHGPETTVNAYVDYTRTVDLSKGVELLGKPDKT